MTQTKRKTSTSKTKTSKKTTIKKNNSIGKELYFDWYEKMLLMRRFEEKVGQLYTQQKIKGFCHLYIGQEACAMGVVSALEEGDKYITSYRDHAIPIALGTEPEKIMAELFAKKTGVSKGRGGSMHMFDSKRGFAGGHGIVGGQIPLGAGLGFAEQYKNTGKLSVTFMGDGAVRQGAFHEALNLAMHYLLPCIFIIENNKYAMGTSVKRTSNVTDLHLLGKSYDMPSKSVNGMEVEEIYKSVSEAAVRARQGKGPTLLEFNTYRYKGHSMSDPAKYRTKEELDEYKKKDPIVHVKSILLSKKWKTEEDLIALNKKIKETVLGYVKFAEESPFPDVSELYENIYVQEDYPFIKN